MVIHRAIRSLLRRLLLVVASVAATAGAASDAGNGSAQWRWSNVERVVVFGDVHGAYDGLVGLLRATHVVDENLAWVGGATHLVSLGDLLDRGPKSRQVLDLLLRLEPQADKAGGAVHVVLGNHELMNLSGDLRYVVPGDYAAFSGEETDAMRNAAFVRYQQVQPAAQTPAADRHTFDERYPAGYFARQAAFASAGVYGSWLAQQPFVIVINDIAFLHGGLAPVIDAAGVDVLNQRFHRDLGELLALEAQLAAVGYDADAAADLVVQADLLRKSTVGAPPPPSALEQLARQFTKLSTSPLFSDAGPLWYRGTALCHGLVEQGLIERGLAALAAKAVVIGHTPTADRRVQQRQGGKVILLDTGMLESYYHGHPAALVIEAGHIGVVYGDSQAGAEPEDADAGVGRGWSRDALERFLTDAPIGESRSVTRDGRNELALQLKASEPDGQTVPGTFVSGNTTQNAAELAAYRLDVMLGLNLVPVTVSRKVDGMAGVVISAPDRVITEADRRQQQKVRPNWCAVGNDYQLMYVFDALIGNDRRTVTDISYDVGNWRLRLTGNARAFPTTRTIPRASPTAEQVVPKGLADRLAALDIQRMQAALGSLLNKKQLDALLARRDQILKTWKPAG